MPGVPSSRGCDACRKQKKKCITASATPPCSRCRRLGITCAGFGQQRFKFKNEGQRLVVPNRNSTTGFKNGSRNARGLVTRAVPSYGLANSLTRLTSALISNIDPSIDISIQLPWNFGAYLLEIPRRIGTNEALDAASEALVASYTSFVAGQGVTPHAIIKHSKALRSLRQCLNDPVTAQSSETLCSIMILMIVQLLSAPDIHLTTSHAVAALEILKFRGHTSPKDEFEGILLATLKSTVIAEAVTNPHIKMSQQEWKDFVSSHFFYNTIDGQMMRCLAHLPSLMERGRDAVKQPSTSGCTLLELRNEVQDLRMTYDPILTSFRERWEKFESGREMEYPGATLSATQIHAHYSRTYGLALSIGIAINCVLVALGDTDPQLTQDTPHFSDEIFKIAKVSIRYRPLGAMCMAICLPAARIGATDPRTKAAISECYLEYLNDIYKPTTASIVAKHEFFEKRITLR